MEKRSHKLSIITLLFSLLLACNNDDPVDADKNKPYNFDFPNILGSKYSLPDDNITTIKGVELGRKLFYEPLLSGDTTMSCATCHKQEYAFSDGGNKLSPGITGDTGTMHTMTIFNTVWQTDFFWDGRAVSLEDQALKPISNPVEMNLSILEAIDRLQNHDTYPSLFEEAFGSSVIDSTNLAKAISQFERTLISGNSKYDKYKNGLVDFTEQEKHGEQLFFTHPEADAGIRGANCGDCHTGTLTQANLFSNNGLDSQPDNGRYDVTLSNADKGKFKIPSLRNIAVSAPYMHDGRFSTLEEVLDHYNEHIEFSITLDPLIIEASNNVGGNTLGLTEQEKKDIVAFLKTLTDEEFLTNPVFSNPFK